MVRSTNKKTRTPPPPPTTTTSASSSPARSPFVMSKQTTSTAHHRGTSHAVGGERSDEASRRRAEQAEKRILAQRRAKDLHKGEVKPKEAYIQTRATVVPPSATPVVFQSPPRMMMEVDNDHEEEEDVGDMDEYQATMCKWNHLVYTLHHHKIMLESKMHSVEPYKSKIEVVEKQGRHVCRELLGLCGELLSE